MVFAAAGKLDHQAIEQAVMKRWASLWLPVVIWCGVIFTLSSIPNLRITREWWDYPLRKIAHMTEYGILARLWVRALAGSAAWSRKKIFAWSLVLSVLYACTDEYHQTFVAGREGVLHDVVIDSVGAWLALGLQPFVLEMVGFRSRKRKGPRASRES